MQICAFLFQFGLASSRMYDILWAAVFGFATLNILSLVARRFEPGRTRLTIGEMVAVSAAVLSVLLLGWGRLLLFLAVPIWLVPRWSRIFAELFPEMPNRSVCV